MQQYISRRFIMFFMILVAVLALVFGLVHYALDNKGGDTAANTPAEEGSVDLAEAVLREIDGFLKTLSRAEIIRSSSSESTDSIRSAAPTTCLTLFLCR